MGKFRIGSGQSLPQTVSAGDEIEVEMPKFTEITVERRVEVPVVKEVEVEVQKPVFKLVEVEEKVQKPRVVIEEVPQVVIKPVFTIKQETVVLDQLQKKLDESVKLAQEKLDELNKSHAERAELDHRTLETLQVEAKALKIGLGVCMFLSAVAAIASLLG
jgi:hypothetical protein